MLRMYSSSMCLTRKTSQLVLRQIRPSSGRAGSSGGGVRVVKYVGASLLVTSIGVGGTIGYAGVDDQFRMLVEENVPGADEVMEMLLGKRTPVKPISDVPKLKIGSAVVATHPGKEVEKSPPLSVPSPPQPVLEVLSEEEEPVTGADLISKLEEEPEIEAPALVDNIEEEKVEPSQLELEVPPPVIEESITPEVVPTEVDEPVILEEASPQVDPSAEVVSTEPVKVGEPEAVDKIDAVKVESVLTTGSEDISAQAVDKATNNDANIEIEPVLEDDKVMEAVEVKVEVNVSETLSNIPLPEDIENTSLETVLFELCKEMKVMVEGAVTGYEVATDTVTNHMNIMKEVLDTNLTSKDEAAWNKMFEAAVAKSDAAKCAEIKEKEAVAAIENVIEIIAAGRKSKATANNLELMVAEESANRAIAFLEEAKAEGAALRSELKVMEDYRDLVEAGREQFHQEMASIMPDVRLGEKNGKLNEDELNMFITHAYKKVLHLQQDLARQQTLEQEKFKKTLEKQRVDIQVGESQKMEMELAKQARDMVVEQDKKMEIIKEGVERDIRSQLRRQAAAHSDHLQDMLSVQEAELLRKHEHSLSEELTVTRSSQLEKLSSLSGMVSGLSTSLQARQQQDQRAVTSQQLWIACSGLDAALDTMKPLMGEVVIIKTAATPSDDFVNIVLSSMSPLALDRGVYTLNSLKERFSKVERTARRVAEVGKDGGSLLSYGLSYLQSVLTVDLTVRSPMEREEEMDLSKMSQTDILTMAKHSLERNNLARAVQYTTLLKGESSRVVSDWLAEARLTMETRQAVDALVAHAAGENVNTLS